MTAAGLPHLGYDTDPHPEPPPLLEAPLISGPPPPPPYGPLLPGSPSSMLLLGHHHHSLPLSSPYHRHKRQAEDQAILPALVTPLDSGLTENISTDSVPPASDSNDTSDLLGGGSGPYPGAGIPYPGFASPYPPFGRSPILGLGAYPGYPPRFPGYPGYPGVQGGPGYLGISGYPPLYPGYGRGYPYRPPHLGGHHGGH